MSISRFPIIIFFICLIAVGITFLAVKLAKGKVIIKYLPSIISAVGGIGFYIKSIFFSRSFEDIGFMLLAIVAGIFTVAALATVAVMDIFCKRKSKNRLT